MFFLFLFLFFFSYKENESNEETDSDEIIEATGGADENDNSEVIEKVLKHRVGRKGSKFFVIIFVIIFNVWKVHSPTYGAHFNGSFIHNLFRRLSVKNLWFLMICPGFRIFYKLLFASKYPPRKERSSLYCVQTSSFLFVGMWRVCKSSKVKHPGGSGGFVL